MAERKGVVSAIGAQLVKLEGIAFLVGLAIGVIGFILAVRYGFVPEDTARNILGLAMQQSP